jgi:hypothetical protein
MWGWIEVKRYVIILISMFWYMHLSYICFVVPLVCAYKVLNFNCGLKCFNNWVVGATIEVRYIEYGDTSSISKTHNEHTRTSSLVGMLSCSNHMKLTPSTSPNKSKTNVMSPHRIHEDFKGEEEVNFLLPIDEKGSCLKNPMQRYFWFSWCKTRSWGEIIKTNYQQPGRHYVGYLWSWVHPSFMYMNFRPPTSLSYIYLNWVPMFELQPCHYKKRVQL